jgi:hypothetical protein
LSFEASCSRAAFEIGGCDVQPNRNPFRAEHCTCVGEGGDANEIDERVDRNLGDCARVGGRGVDWQGFTRARAGRCLVDKPWATSSGRRNRVDRADNDGCRFRVEETRDARHSIGKGSEGEVAAITAVFFTLSDARFVEIVTRPPCKGRESLKRHTCGCGNEFAGGTRECIRSHALGRDTESATDCLRRGKRQRPRSDGFRDAREPRRGGFDGSSRGGIVLDDEGSDADEGAGIRTAQSRHVLHESFGRARASALSETVVPELSSRPVGDLGGNDRRGSIKHASLVRKPTLR